MMSSVLNSAIILCTLLVCVQSTDVSHCQLVDAPLPDVDIPDCKGSPCTFYKNSTGVMTMKFKSPRYLEHIAPQAVAVVGPLHVTYPLDQTDACDGVTNTPCPLAEDEYVEYTYGMVILPVFPQIGITLEFSLLDLDADKEAVECFSVDLQIKNQ